MAAVRSRNRPRADAGERGGHDADQRPVADYRSLRAMWGWLGWQLSKYTNRMIIYNGATTATPISPRLASTRRGSSSPRVEGPKLAHSMVTLRDKLDSAARDAEPATISATRALLRGEPRDLAVCQTAGNQSRPFLPRRRAWMAIPRCGWQFSFPIARRRIERAPISFGANTGKELAKGPP